LVEYSYKLKGIIFTMSNQPPDFVTIMSVLFDIGRQRCSLSAGWLF
jgi:hypothetical protein